MDEFHHLSSIKHPQDDIITFRESCRSKIKKQNDECVLEDFARCFSIDDDDIVLLDSPESVSDEIKILLDEVINQILNEESLQCQIKQTNYEESFFNQLVRSNQSDDKQQQQPLLSTLFVSESLPTLNQSNSPYTQFLYHLGFDLCLEQNLQTQNSLTELQKQTLVQRNQAFHRYRTYRCKHCSFRTDTIHALKHHYRTPHILPNFPSPHPKYHCIYCAFQTFRIPDLRRHFERKHGCQLISEHSSRRYSCCFCYYDTDDKSSFLKHNQRCEIEQRRTCLANNLLAPCDQSTGTRQKTTYQSIRRKLADETVENILKCLNNDKNIEPIVIESDHDSSSISKTTSSDEEFIVSSDEDSSPTGKEQTDNNRHFKMSKECRLKKNLQPNSRPAASLPISSISLVSSSSAPVSTLPSLSKLLLLNTTPIPSLTSSTSQPLKPSLISIQPKPTTLDDAYQMCNMCQCYIYRKDYLKHMNEQHRNPSLQTLSTPISILNNTINNISTTVACLPPTLIVAKPTSQSSSAILLLSTAKMGLQSITLNMIKCPWCDTNFEHIDIITGHLMRYHRMTLAAAKVVVAEQMKIQGTSSSQLSLLFKKEIEQMQNEFNDKIYWKISQPKVYLHQIETVSCFMCNIMVDDLANHLTTIHQTQIETLNSVKQCSLCGFTCDQKKPSSLCEHQLRTHAGVCYSSTLKQFIRFEPPPSPTLPVNGKDHARLILPSSSSSGRVLVTQTEKKFGCRKCDTSSRLFTFEELVEHLRKTHDLNVKLHRRCIFCQETFAKGTEYNEHCLKHLNDEQPSIKLKRQRVN
ncbi:unnamed protein product [Adineta ricciae]|uniref:C2H2-type domain-containing protein n=1 Tax=Adineta ricciae TaxID=249248 RepID=A0A813N2C5_ADIRI|nr:unnamed protein product [Adineta ricciae]CAF1485189.1 unnamed protein product [Adineta ricciae]